MNKAQRDSLVEAQSVILRIPNWLGDVVNSTVIVQQIRSLMPHAEVTAFGQDYVLDVLKGHPFIDSFISYKKSKSRFEYKETAAAIRKIRQRRFDVGVLLTNSASSALTFALSSVKRRIGFADGARRLLLTDSVPFPKNKAGQHVVLTYQSLLGSSDERLIPQVFVTQTEQVEARQRVSALKRPLVGINPGSAFGPAKNWLPERFRELIQRLEAEGIGTLLVGDASSQGLCEEIARGTACQSFAGKSNLRQLMAMLSICDVVLSGDSGPLHLADALGVPTVAIFGSTDPGISAPYSKRGTVLYEKQPCAPCHKRNCPIHFPCMKAISVSSVYEACLAELGTLSII